jgi:transketolase
MPYRARASVCDGGRSRLGPRGRIVTLDYNHFGIDGPITEVLPSAYLNHWFSLGWNIIEVDGQNVRELAYAYRLAADGFGGEKPTVVICHTTKGLVYGKIENSADSHGALLPHPEYVAAMHKLGFPIPGVKGDVAADIRVVVAVLGEGEVAYLLERMKTALAGRPLVDYRKIERPAELPPELVFKGGDSVAIRKATEAWFAWAMKQTAFFIMLAAHDGPETGEDGPTHHGLFWMSLYTAYPGIKVYKPLDANEAVEMLFLAAQRGEPVAFSCTRPGTPVLKRGDGVPEARFDVKIVAVTSPQLYEELRRTDPARAAAILSDEERQYVVALHNGWPGFLYPFVMPGDYRSRVFGMDRFSRSGKPDEIYRNAGFDCEGLRKKILTSGAGTNRHL